MVMATWNSIPLEIISKTFGWIAFCSWAICGYPQLILNFRRKRVVGLSFDHVVLDLTKQSSYLIYNASLYFSRTIQKQYFEKYGYDEMIPVAANDVAFSINAVLVTVTMLTQISIYDRGNQKVSKIFTAIVYVVWLFAGVCFFIALPSHSWLWLISIFNSIQVFMAIIKYIPQAVLNFRRKSTDGFCIETVLLSLTGGVANYAQMAVQSIDQNSLVNFYGNMGKTLLCLVSVFFGLVFTCQHYILYPAKKAVVSFKVLDKDCTAEPLNKSSEDSELGNALVY